MDRRPLRRVAALAALLAVPAAAGAPPAREKLRVGISPALTSISVFIALEKGYFAAQGLDIELLISHSSARELLPLLATGKIDVAGAVLNAAFFNAAASGSGVKLVADKGQQPETGSYRALVVSRKLAPARVDAATLKGRRFAVVTKGSASEIVLERFLQEHGLSLADVELVSMPYPEINAALASGAIFGAEQIEPFLSAAKKDGHAVELAPSGRYYPRQQGGVLIYSDFFASSRTAAADAFMRAYIKGARFYLDAIEGRADPREAFAAFQKHTGYDDYESFTAMQAPHLDSDGRLNLKSVAADLAWYRAHGYVEKPLDLKNAVDMSFAERAAKSLGPWKKKR